MAAPVNALHYAGVFLLAYGYYIADLKGAIGVKGNTCEEISQSVLQSEADDYAKDGGRGENCTELYVVVERFEDEDEKNSEYYERKDVANQGGCFVAAANAKRKVKDGRIDDPHAEVSKQSPEYERRDPKPIRFWMGGLLSLALCRPARTPGQGREV